MLTDRCPCCLGGSISVIDSVDRATLVAGYAAAGLEIDISRQVSPKWATVSLNACAECGMKWYTPAIAGNGEFYVQLQKHDWYYQLEKSEYEFARRHVSPAAIVLEVGCGSGAFQKHLPQSLTYRGLEFNTGAVKIARAAGLDVEMRAIEDEARDQAGRYDVVCHFQVLEHVSDPRAFMRSCAQALKPGGTLIVAVPAEDSFIGLAESSWLNMPPHHLSRWTDGALSRLFNEVDVEPGACWHEPVADIHRNWHRSVVANAGLYNLLGKQPRLVAGAVTRLAARLRRSKTIDQILFSRGLAANPNAGRGHSVCLVGRKR